MKQMETIFACVLCVSSWSKDGGEKRGGTFEEKSDLQEDEYAVSGEIMSLSHQMLKLRLNLWNSFFVNSWHAVLFWASLEFGLSLY